MCQEDMAVRDHERVSLAQRIPITTLTIDTLSLSLSFSRISIDMFAAR